MNLLLKFANFLIVINLQRNHGTSSVITQYRYYYQRRRHTNLGEIGKHVVGRCPIIPKSQNLIQLGTCGRQNRNFMLSLQQFAPIKVYNYSFRTLSSE